MKALLNLIESCEDKELKEAAQAEYDEGQEAIEVLGIFNKFIAVHFPVRFFPCFESKGLTTVDKGVLTENLNLDAILHEAVATVTRAITNKNLAVSKWLLKIVDLSDVESPCENENKS